MSKFIGKRLLQGLITLFVISIVVFMLARLTGDPLDLLLPPQATPQDYAVLRNELGLDQPYPVQYYKWLTHVVRGDFGKSLQTNTSAIGMVLDRLPNSIYLGLLAILIAVALTIPLGVLAAVTRGTVLDGAIKILAFVGLAAPSFLVGAILIEVFSVRLGVLPVAGMGGVANFVLPAFTLSLFSVGAMVRLLRSSMLDVLDREYIKLARLKGVHEVWVLWKHALRNALIPVVTFGGVYLALVLTAAVVVETVFAWPGVGRLSYDAIMHRDFPVVQAVVIVVAALVILVNILVDVSYAYLDPRIRA